MFFECRHATAPIGRLSEEQTCHTSETLVLSRQLTAVDMFDTHASVKKSERVMRVVTK